MRRLNTLIQYATPIILNFLGWFRGIVVERWSFHKLTTTTFNRVLIIISGQSNLTKSASRGAHSVVGRWLVGCHVRALWPNGTLIGNPTPGILG